MRGWVTRRRGLEKVGRGRGVRVRVRGEGGGLKHNSSLLLLKKIKFGLVY